MGAALGPLALALFNAGAPLALSNALVGVGLGGTLLAGAARLALGVGASLIANRLLAPKPKPTDNQIETRQPVPPRAWVYGRHKVSGPLAFWEAKEADLGAFGPHQTLYKVVMLSAREIDAVEGVYLNDRLVEIDPADDGVTTAPYVTTSPEKRLVHLVTHLGEDGQAADTMLMAAWPSEWTSSHRLRGIAYIAGAFAAPQSVENFSEAYPSGEPAVSAVIRGNKLYDPRLDSSISGGSGAHRIADETTWAWSENSALCVLDWLHHSDGFAISSAEINMQSFQDFADLCDEAVSLAAGGTETRYAVATTVYLSEPRTDVLTRLLESCDGQIYRGRDNKIAIRGGQYVAPAATLDADEHHIYGLSISEPDGLSRYNELIIQYMETGLGYVEAECDPWRDEADIAAHGLNSRTIDLTQVPSFSRARRLAKIRMAKENPDWLIDVQANLAGIDAIGEEAVNLAFSEMLIDGEFWLDRSPTISEDFTTVSLSMRSASSAAYDWTTAEEGTPPTIPEDTSPHAPQGLNYSKTRASFHWLFLNGL